MQRIPKTSKYNTKQKWNNTKNAISSMIWNSSLDQSTTQPKSVSSLKFRAYAMLDSYSRNHINKYVKAGPLCIPFLLLGIWWNLFTSEVQKHPSFTHVAENAYFIMKTRKKESKNLNNTESFKELPTTHFPIAWEYRQ